MPDYYDVIKNPMDWQTMGEKLERHEYDTVKDFVDDVELVVSNARMYNKRDTVIHRTAVKLREQALPILAQLDGLDDEGSSTAVIRAHLTELLTDEVVDELFEYTGELPPPKPKKSAKVGAGTTPASAPATGDGGDAHNGAPLSEPAQASDPNAPKKRGRPLGSRNKVKDKDDKKDKKRSADEAGLMKRDKAAKKRALREAEDNGKSPKKTRSAAAAETAATTTTATAATTRSKPMEVKDVDPAASFTLFEKGCVESTCVCSIASS